MKPWTTDIRASEIDAWKRWTFVSGAVLALLTWWAALQRAPVMVLSLVQTQDVSILVLAAAAFVLVALWRPRWALPSRLPSPWVLLAAGFGLSALLAWASYGIMGNFPVSRDEHMVVFDMAIFGSGRLAMPIPPEWRPYALDLVPKFLLNSNHPTGFVSSYLPVNAMLRLAFSKIADPAWYNPLLVLLGGVALLDIAKRTFGPTNRACLVVLLVFGLSAQMLVNAMTTFSLTGHLALNLVWLAAFLRGGKFWNSVAILVGFLAVGLHQLVFHPIFVAPFLLWKLRDGEWKTVALFTAAYAAIGLWWIYYPPMISPLVADAGARASDADFVSQRVVPLLLNRDPRAIPLTILNMIRFVAWQNLALLPLLVAAVPVAFRQRGLARALLIGTIIWIVFLALVLPEQGRGWGYRYLNGYLGSFALLAGFGYRELEHRIGRQADGMVILLSGATVALAIPLLFTTTYRLMQPHLALDRLIASQRTPFVLIDDTVSASVDGQFADDAGDHVRNLPDLSNRPLRFSSDNLTSPLLAELCRKGPVAVITRGDMHRVRFISNVPERSPKFEALVSSVNARGCFRPAT